MAGPGSGPRPPRLTEPTTSVSGVCAHEHDAARQLWARADVGQGGADVGESLEVGRVSEVGAEGAEQDRQADAGRDRGEDQGKQAVVLAYETGLT